MKKLSKIKKKDFKIFANKSKLKTQFLKDPIHNEINFEGETLWMYDLLETSEFKRLKYIKQLGLSSFFFPGATHTRAAHCLGTYEVMRQTLLNPSFRCINKIDRLTLMCAALLHDLGHAPHSHAFEDYMALSLGNKNDYIFRHEIMSARLLTNPKGEIAPILLKNNIDPELVASLIFSNNKFKNFPIWMSQLISSEIDVDRIDYLLRDSYYTGANYGSIDINGLLHWIVFDSSNNSISYVKKAVPIIENFLVGRYHMYQTVYLNEKTSLLVAVLWFAFKRIRLLDYHNKFNWYEFNYIRDVIRALYSKKNINEIDLNKFILMTDSSFETFLQTIYTNTQDKILKKILDSYFIQNDYVFIMFKDQKYRDELYTKIANDKNTEFNLAKYNYQTKSFYSPNEDFLEIMILDENFKKTISITEESQLIKNGNKIFNKNEKYLFGILTHKQLLKKVLSFVKLSKLEYNKNR